jgi:hypothetical protein
VQIATFGFLIGRRDTLRLTALTPTLLIGGEDRIDVTRINSLPGHLAAGGTLGQRSHATSDP